MNNEDTCVLAILILGLPAWILWIAGVLIGVYEEITDLFKDKD